MLVPGWLGWHWWRVWTACGGDRVADLRLGGVSLVWIRSGDRLPPGWLLWWWFQGLVLRLWVKDHRWRMGWCHLVILETKKYSTRSYCMQWLTLS